MSWKSRVQALVWRNLKAELTKTLRVWNKLNS